jgi:hypothetical protein
MEVRRRSSAHAVNPNRLNAGIELNERPGLTDNVNGFPKT